MIYLNIAKTFFVKGLFDMKKLNFNKSWLFKLEKDLESFNDYGFKKYNSAIGAANRYYKYSNWQKIDLPHDWAVSLQKTLDANAFAGGFPNTHGDRFRSMGKSMAEEIASVGWYRKEFTLGEEYKDKRLFIEFEGIFRDAIIWINGTYMTRHTSGYNSLIFEITDHVRIHEENSIAVRVDSEQGEGWWYEGSGIYRNVNLFVAESVYFKPRKTFARTDMEGKIDADAVLVNDTAFAVEKTVVAQIIDKNGETVAENSINVAVDAYGESLFNIKMQVEAPALWDVEEPNLYTFRLSVEDEVDDTVIGFRTFTFDADKGFFLNGKHIKLRGACVHHDLGGVGVALTDNLNRYKIQRLKDMGVNAYRCSHNAPSPALLKACDELGMLVMDETRMFGSSPEAIEQLTNVIERDRNHACVFIWSIGNEEFDVQDLDWGRRLAEKAVRIIKKLDDTRLTIYSGNNGANFVGANGATDVRGINYIHNGQSSWVEKYHKDHPDQPIIGSEESSFVLSRGGMKNDLANGAIDATGNVTMPWGSSLKGWTKFFEERDFLLGGFMWTGFDYRGEPNPFYQRNVVSSFGVIDLCGMEKPPFYYHKAWWTDETVLKILPGWNHDVVGEVVTICVNTNCEEIKLTLNGRVVAEQKVEKFDAPVFELAYEPGELVAEGIKDGKTYTDRVVTSGKTENVKVEKVLAAESDEDIEIYEIIGLDGEGRFNPSASEKIALSVTDGKIVGVGNGDPACLDKEQFMPREESFAITALECDGRTIPLPDKEGNVRGKRYDWLLPKQKDEGYEDDYRIVAMYAYSAEPPKTKTYTATIRGAVGYDYVEFERLGGKTEVYLNGEKLGDNFTYRMPRSSADSFNRPFRFYCDFAEINELKLVYTYTEADKLAASGYIKVGREVEADDVSVRLHYGRARVFVKPDPTSELELEAKIIARV